MVLRFLFWGVNFVAFPSISQVMMFDVYAEWVVFHYDLDSMLLIMGCVVLDLTVEDLVCLCCI